MCDLPSPIFESTSEYYIPDESLFMISSFDPWYGGFLIYLQTHNFWPNTSRSKQRCIRYESRNYAIIGDTLYRRGINMILQRWLTFEEVEKVLD